MRNLKMPCYAVIVRLKPQRQRYKPTFHNHLPAKQQVIFLPWSTSLNRSAVSSTVSSGRNFAREWSVFSRKFSTKSKKATIAHWTPFHPKLCYCSRWSTLLQLGWESLTWILRILGRQSHQGLHISLYHLSCCVRLLYFSHFQCNVLVMHVHAAWPYTKRIFIQLWSHIFAVIEVRTMLQASFNQTRNRHV